jgi:hypothetical protein
MLEADISHCQPLSFDHMYPKRIRRRDGAAHAQPCQAGALALKLFRLVIR